MSRCLAGPGRVALAGVHDRPRQLVREQHVGQLRAVIGLQGLVGRALELQVVEIEVADSPSEAL